jgi:hypothetical protein
VRTRVKRFLFGTLLGVVFLYCFPYFEGMQSANELPRVYLTMAMVDEGTFAIDTGVERWGVTADMSPSGGHTYSNKAPGSSMLAIPAYALLKFTRGLTGAEPSLAEITWTCRIVTGVLPTLLFLFMLWRFLGRFAGEPRTRRLLLTGYGLGSMALTYSVIFVSHQLAAICIASAYIISVWVIEEGLDKRWMGLMGFLAGCAPLVDYQAAFAGVPIAVYVLYHLLVKSREKALGVLYAVLGAAAPIAVLLSYHAMAFGSPFRTGYAASESCSCSQSQGGSFWASESSGGTWASHLAWQSSTWHLYLVLFSGEAGGRSVRDTSQPCCPSSWSPSRSRWHGQNVAGLLGLSLSG